jgi:hypothetical protein
MVCAMWMVILTIQLYPKTETGLKELESNSDRKAEITHERSRS